MMKRTHYVTTTVQAGHWLEIEVPDYPVGQIVEVVVLVPDVRKAEWAIGYSQRSLTLEPPLSTSLLN